MRCPHCGDKIHDPGLDRFCPSCGKELPHESPDERAMKRDVRVSVGLFTLSLIMVILGASFLLPDIIIHAIDPEMHLMYWPYSLIILVLGIALIAVRHPFAKRSRKHAAVVLEQAQARSACQYCGADNLAGTGKCASCGAPLRK